MRPYVGGMGGVGDRSGDYERSARENVTCARGGNGQQHLGGYRWSVPVTGTVPFPF